MALLKKEDRINMSKKIVSIPEENKIIDNTKKEMQKQKKKAEEEDALNASLQKRYDDKINIYQKELNILDGKKRTEITETIINNAAQQRDRNGFFLADPDYPIPTLPGGVWEFFSPMAFTYAIGKDRQEGYGSEPLNETVILSNLKKIISEVESFEDPTRATGKQCSQDFFCEGGVGETQEECESGDPPGVWTQQSIISESVDIKNLLSNLKNEIQKWTNSLSKQKVYIQINDKDVAQRQAQNQTAYNDVTDTLLVIKNWQEIQDFDLNKKFSENPLDLDLCRKFNQLKYNSYCSDRTYTDKESCEINGETWYETFEESKLSLIEIKKLKDKIYNRSSFINIRKSQISEYLGKISQDLKTGNIKSKSGWYGARYLILESRLNLMSGSATAKFSADKGVIVQDQIKESNNKKSESYNAIMKATKAVAPGLDTQYLNVEDASSFKVGDEVYVVANDLEELSGTLLEKDGNRVKLSFSIPKKYNLGNLTRLYKISSDPI